jgi:pyridoxine/pyridoxamine 5'-phosphate oxidase
MDLKQMKTQTWHHWQSSTKKVRMTTIIHNLSTDEQIIYVNKADPLENLISCFMWKTGQTDKLTDKQERNKIREQVRDGDKTYAIGDYCVMKPKKYAAEVVLAEVRILKSRTTDNTADLTDAEIIDDLPF